MYERILSNQLDDIKPLDFDEQQVQLTDNEEKLLLSADK